MGEHEGRGGGRREEDGGQVHREGRGSPSFLAPSALQHRPPFPTISEVQVVREGMDSISSWERGQRLTVGYLGSK